MAKLRQYENENTASLKVFFIRLSSSLHLRAREREKRERDAHIHDELSSRRKLFLRARQRERERERDDDDDELSSRRRAVESNARASGGEEFGVLRYLLTRGSRYATIIVVDFLYRNGR